MHSRRHFLYVICREFVGQLKYILYGVCYRYGNAGGSVRESLDASSLEKLYLLDG